MSMESESTAASSTPHATAPVQRGVTRRVWILVAVIALCTIGGIGYAVLPTRHATTSGDAALPSSPSSTLDSPPNRPFVVVRSLLPGDTFNRVGLAPLDSPTAPRYITPLSCDRVFFAANRGVCLVVTYEGLLTKHYADVFDERFERLHRVPLTGVPSRARVSPDGRRAGVTVFEHGHSYAEDGFSTRTTLIDTITGKSLGDLEQFAAWRDGARFRAADFNYWGVTFASDSNRFYATLATGGTKYLVEGDVEARTVRVVHTGVECPSLSPDNNRIAYKKLFKDARGSGWELHVLNLITSADTSLTGEKRSVDDQVDWLDNDHIVYHLSGSEGADVWALRTDGTEPPRVLVRFAYSPAIVR